jgi:tripartite-type tricarboxylate transporter receptor subunit TctC
MKTMNLRRVMLCSLACALLMAGDAYAQAYPSKPIRIIAPSPPGGPVDVLARLVGDSMAQGLGQTVVVENRPGAGAIIGSRAVASAEPDGYTLLLGASGSLAVTPALFKNAGYDPVKSFAPIAAVSQGALLLAVTPSLPVRPWRSWSPTPRPIRASSTTARASA